MNKELSKEIAIRRRINGIFNKREDDFASLREYNDYLEHVEDLIFNLIEGINVQAIEAEVSKYQEENAEQIIASRARKAEELSTALRGQYGHDQVSTTTTTVVDQPAQPGPSAGQYAPAVAAAGGLFMQPRPTAPIPHDGHDADGSCEDEETRKLREERGARAGGWSAELSRRRALEEAFSSLWVN